MAKQIIAVDIDDVLADSTESMRQLVNDRLGVELTKDHYMVEGEYWGYYERVWHTHGIGDRVSHDVLSEEMAIDQSHVPLLAGASFALTELSKSFKLALLTSRNESWKKATEEWVRSHFGDLFEKVFFTRINGIKKTKGELCTEIGAKWLIDDNVEHCQSALASNVTAILFGQYGWHTSVPSSIVKCRDWPSVLEYFDGQS